MRRRLPAIERAALIRIDAGALDADEELPALLAVAELGDRPGWLQRRVVLRQTRRTDPPAVAGLPALPATCRASQPSTVCDESPRVCEGGLGSLSGSICSASLASVDRGLALGESPSSLSRIGATTRPTG